MCSFKRSFGIKEREGSEGQTVATEKKAVVLSSGGIDSTTAMAIARSEGFEIYSLSFHYGQRHAIELESAQRVGKALGAKEHLIVDVDLTKIGGSALTGEFEVPKGRKNEEMRREIPLTYVPGRNTLFLSYAMAWAEVVGAADIFIGVNAIDYSGYPDCRPEFIKAFEEMANLATKAGVEGRIQFRINAPLIQMTKAEIIRKGVELGLDYSITMSCYDPSQEGKACGQCDSCILRMKGFQEAGVPDPTSYL